MKKEKLLVPIIIILAMIVQTIFPIMAYADDEITLSIDLENDKTNKKINITVTDTTYNVTDLKYVHKSITKDEVSYFEEDNEDVYSIEITPGKEITESFSYTEYGTYTVYAKNSNGYKFLSRITLTDPDALPQITYTRDSNNDKHIDITITSKSTLTKLKIAPESDLGEEIDFSTTGTDIPFEKDEEEENTYTATYTAEEEGLYAIYAENEDNYSKISEPYLGKLISVTPTNLDDSLKINDESGKLKFTVTDKLWNISEVRIAKLSDLEDYKEASTKGESLEIETPDKTLNMEYTISEDATYVIFVKDINNRGLYYTTRIMVSNEEAASITVTQDTENPKKLTITATDNLANITEMIVAVGKDLDVDYIKENGTSLTIEEGKTVTAEYEVEENCTLYVYIKDADNSSYYISKTISGIDDPVVDPITVTLSQPDNTSGEVQITATSITSNIAKIKYAEGSKDKEYFAENGTEIEITTLGKIVQTSFTAEESGVYTVYVINADGNESVKEITVTINGDEPEPTLELGDINGDGKINLVDVLKLRRYIANQSKETPNEDWDLTEEEQERANVNKDDKINIADVLALRRYIAAHSNDTIAENHQDWLKF